MSDELNRVGAPGLAPEEIPSLDDFYEEPGGNITPGWYDAEVLPGYATSKGTQFTTADEPFKDGRRIFRLCFGLNVNGSQRNLQKSFFYTPESFSMENLAHIKQLREQFAASKQKSWTGHGKDQNFSITLGHLSQLEKAIGFKIARHPGTGGLLATPYVGKKLRVRVSTGQKGYDEVSGFRPRA